MSEVITPQPAVPTQTPPAPPEMKPVKKGKKKAVKNAIILAIVAGVLAIGGFLLYKFLHSGGEEQGEIMAQRCRRSLSLAARLSWPAIPCTPFTVRQPRML